MGGVWAGEGEPDVAGGHEEWTEEDEQRLNEETEEWEGRTGPRYEIRSKDREQEEGEVQEQWVQETQVGAYGEPWVCACVSAIFGAILLSSSVFLHSLFRRLSAPCGLP